MASSNSESSPPSLEELSVTTVLLPWILGIDPPREVAVFVNQPTGSITVIEGSLDIESILREIPIEQVPLPATKASIEALPRVQVSDPGMECSICLAECEVNREAKVKQMPCSHKFHAGCIDKWLGIRGSCPICRFSMPVEENNESNESGRTGINVFIFQGMDDPDSESGTDETGTGQDEDHDMESGRDDADDDGNDELPAQGMEMDYID